MFIFLCLVCPRWVDPSQCRSEKGEESSGRKASCPDPGFQTTPSVEKISPARQDNLPQAQTADSSSRNAVSFSSARTLLHGITGSNSPRTRVLPFASPRNAASFSSARTMNCFSSRCASASESRERVALHLSDGHIHPPRLAKWDRDRSDWCAHRQVRRHGYRGEPDVDRRAREPPAVSVCRQVE